MDGLTTPPPSSPIATLRPVREPPPLSAGWVDGSDGEHSTAARPISRGESLRERF